jgi:hypothetical protein
MEMDRSEQEGHGKCTFEVINELLNLFHKLRK